MLIRRVLTPLMTSCGAAPYASLIPLPTGVTTPEVMMIPTTPPISPSSLFLTLLPQVPLHSGTPNNGRCGM